MTAWSAAPARAQVVSRRWIELALGATSYDSATVSDPHRYLVTSVDDPSFAAGVAPVLVHHRHFPASGPYADALGGDVFRIEMDYHVFLRLPQPLCEGKTYTVSTAGAAQGGPFTFTFDSAALNEALRVNQVAYLADGPKIAYLSAWTGQGSIDFEAPTAFYLVEEPSLDKVWSGPIRLDATAAQDPLSRSDVRSLDFSAFTGEGTYHLVVPGVGASRSFRIDRRAYHDIGYTVFRGLTMQRDGDHGLTPAVTRWSRPPAHLDDAIVESTGLRAPLAGGHMDAGDRGKYPHNSADAVATLLTALMLFPAEVEALGESLQIRESGNGIPDLVDEVVYELEFLRALVDETPGDGTLPFYLRPQNPNGSGGYELGSPPEGKANRKLFDASMGPNRSETLYVAGALAMAYNTPLLQKYVPERAAAYLLAAQRAFAGFATHHGEAGYFRDAGWYDPWTLGPHPWSDEMLVAAANLFEATGDTAYVPWIQSEMPADLRAVKRWSWSLSGPWLPAFVSLSRVTRPALAAALPGVQERARDAAANWADATLGRGHTVYPATFGAPIPPDVYSNVGWYFTGEQTAYPLMVGYGVTGNPRYREALVKTWSYLLGTNPLGRSFVSGLGAPERRPRWLVHEIGLYQWMRDRAGDPAGWTEVPPGLPAADVQKGRYDASSTHDPWNLARKDDMAPGLGNYPVLLRYHDSWNPSDEFTIAVMARQAASLVPLLSREPDPARARLLTVAPQPVSSSGCGCPSAGGAGNGGAGGGGALALLAMGVGVRRRRGRRRGQGRVG